MNRDKETIEDLRIKLNSVQKRVLELRDDKDRLIQERDDARDCAYILRAVLVLHGDERFALPWERKEEEDFCLRPCLNCKKELPADWKYAFCSECGDNYEETEEDLHRADLEFDARREKW